VQRGLIRTFERFIGQNGRGRRPDRRRGQGIGRLYNPGTTLASTLAEADEARCWLLAGFDEMNTTSESIRNGARKMIDRVPIIRAEIERKG
jgi:hypothetical protein